MLKLLITIICIVLMAIGILFIYVKGRTAYLGAGSLVLSISTPLLFYIPNPVVDLSRYFDEMTYVAQYNNISSLLYSYNHIKSMYNYHAFTFLYDIFQWIISRTGFFNLLPFLSAFIVYISLLIPFINLRNKYNFSFIEIFLGFLSIFILFTYDGTSSTVRWYLASGLFFLITYIYFRKDNFKYHLGCLLLYIPLMFIHEAIILLIILMIFCTFVKKIKWYHILIFVPSFIILFILIGHENSGEESGNVNISNMGNIYENMSLKSYFTVSLASALRTSLSIIIPVIYSIICFCMIKSNKKYLKGLRSEINLYYIINIMEILLLPFMVIFQRYLLFIGIFDIILILEMRRKHIDMTDGLKYCYIIAVFGGFIYFVMGLHGMSFDFSHLVFEF